MKKIVSALAILLKCTKITKNARVANSNSSLFILVPFLCIYFLSYSTYSHLFIPHSYAVEFCILKPALTNPLSSKFICPDFKLKQLLDYLPGISKLTSHKEKTPIHPNLVAPKFSPAQELKLTTNL